VTLAGYFPGAMGGVEGVGMAPIWAGAPRIRAKLIQSALALRSE